MVQAKDASPRRVTAPDLDAAEFRPQTVEPEPLDIYHSNIEHPTKDQLRRGRP